MKSFIDFLKKGSLFFSAGLLSCLLFLLPYASENRSIIIIAPSVMILFGVIMSTTAKESPRWFWKDSDARLILRWGFEYLYKSAVIGIVLYILVSLIKSL